MELDPLATAMRNYENALRNESRPGIGSDGWRTIVIEELEKRRDESRGLNNYISWSDKINEICN